MPKNKFIGPDLYDEQLKDLYVSSAALCILNPKLFDRCRINSLQANILNAIYAAGKTNTLELAYVFNQDRYQLASALKILKNKEYLVKEVIQGGRVINYSIHPEIIVALKQKEAELNIDA